MGRRRRQKGGKRNGHLREVTPAEAAPIASVEETAMAKGEAVSATETPPEPASATSEPAPSEASAIPVPELDDDSEDRVTDPGPPPKRLDVRVEFASDPAPSSLVVLPTPEAARQVPPEDRDPVPPRRAADALPPRNRRSPIPEPIDPITQPRARRLEDLSPIPRGKKPADNRQPEEEAKPQLGRPLFEQEWGSAPSGTPNWRPGSPPIDPTPSRGPVYVVAFTALLGAAVLLLWVALFWN